MKFQANKLQAAHRQLNVAVRLHFQEDDPVAVLTLAGAASRIFADLAERKNPEEWWDRKAWEAVGITRRVYFEVMRRGQDFLKHADRDPEATLAWDEADTESIMFFATLNAGPLDGLSPSAHVFQLWYIASNNHLFADDFEPSVGALKYFAGIGTLCKSEQRHLGLRRLLEELARK